jgi:hypothetical protein
MVLLRSFRITDIDQLRFVALVAFYKVAANDRAFMPLGFSIPSSPARYYLKNFVFKIF